MLRRSAPILLLAACAADPNLSSHEGAITDEGAAYASTFYHWRAVKTAAGMVGGCTATRINARFALTAAHCLDNIMHAEVGHEVTFYPYGAFSPSGRATIEQRFARVNVDACYDDHDDCYDGGKLADIALLRLSASSSNEAMLEGPHATLAWSYPGAEKAGVAVGAGRHNGVDNVNESLKQTSSETDSPNDDNGEFETDEAETDDGDSGGPFYRSGKVVGVLSGTNDYVNTYGLYTSVPYYINWLLTNSGYYWRGQPPQADTSFGGDLIESSVNGETACRYACEKTTECEAYNWRDATGTTSKFCGLYRNVSPASTQAGTRGALKAGRVGTSGEAVGYVRGDGKHAIVHVSNNNRIKELALVDGKWKPYDIHGGAAAVGTPRITAIRRADGVSAVYYRANTGVIYEVALEGDGWHSYALSTIAGAPLAAGAPVAYVRGDGVTAVVYRSTGNHIIELRLGSRGWISRDLNSASGSSSIVVSSDPSVSIRADGTSSIVFRAGTHIWELYQSNDDDVVAGIGRWNWGVPTQLTDPAQPAPPPAIGRPVGYSHRNGIFAIVYRSTTDQIIEVWLDGAGWHWGVLANGAKGDPTAYTRNDGREAVLFRNASNHIIQVLNTSAWTTLDLTSVTGTSATTSDPYVYQRADGYNSVLFESNGHVNELWYKPGQGNWAGGDVTAGAGETP